MSGGSLEGNELRVRAWMDAINNKRLHYAAGVEGALSTIQDAHLADAKRQREIAELEAAWELPPP